MIDQRAIDKFKQLETPLYYYDMDLLKRTLELCKRELDKYGYKAHYALKSNINKRILALIKDYGFGADCVSGNEVMWAYEAGFAPEKIVYAGVGKTDKEIRQALEIGIFSFNCESIAEILIIDELAGEMGKKANISLRINPDVDAHTHKFITTGKKENKFGISLNKLLETIDSIKKCQNVELIGIHFHVGSQITDIDVFATLCEKVNVITSWLKENGMSIKSINLGGGLGIDYDNPLENPIADFERYFSTINRYLHVEEGQEVHFEPGRSLVAQCGALISRVLYVKEGDNIDFLILDAGMNNLIRPALYEANHDIINLTSSGTLHTYDIVGPVCETSDKFASAKSINEAKRGDLIAILSAGAYGEVMSMRYNLKDIANHYYSDNL